MFKHLVLIGLLLLLPTIAMAVPRVVIDCPAHGDTTNLTPTIRFHLENPDSGETYTFEGCTDKGVGACDGRVEECFRFGLATCFTVNLDCDRYTDPERLISAELGIRAIDSHGREVCTQDVRFYVNIDQVVPPCQPCETQSLAVQAFDDTAFVRRSGSVFVVKGDTTYFPGVNIYGLMDWAYQPCRRSWVDQSLDESQAQGLKLIRIWGFFNGIWNGVTGLQPQPGVYNERMFRALDYVLDACRKRGLRVILVLANNWREYGGKRWYMDQCGGGHEDEFFVSPCAEAIYQAFVDTLIHHQNYFNGRIYRDDPTIFGWELMNEPRTESIQFQDGEALHAWIIRNSRFVKSKDPIHLLGIGDEGSYPEDGWGGDLIRNNLIETIDYVTIHSFPDQWGMDFDSTMARARRQHLDARDTIGKPALFEEFGKWRDGVDCSSGRNRKECPPNVQPTTERDGFYRAYCDTVLAYGGDGFAYWMLAPEQFCQYSDCYFVYDPYDASTLQVFTNWIATPTLLSLFQATPVDGGVELRWILHEPSQYVQVVLERAAQTHGPWFAVLDPARSEGGTSVVLDAHVEPNQTYFYRLVAWKNDGTILTFGPFEVVTNERIANLTLRPGAPNPTNGQTRIEFTIPYATGVQLSVFDVQGREVVTLLEGDQRAGRYQVTWSGEEKSGKLVASGMYIVRLQANNRGVTQRIVVVR